MNLANRGLLEPHWNNVSEKGVKPEYSKLNKGQGWKLYGSKYN
jgi:hypothetical protein